MGQALLNFVTLRVTNKTLSTPNDVKPVAPAGAVKSISIIMFQRVLKTRRKQFVF